MSLYNSLDQVRANAAVIASAGTGKAITLRLLGGDSITGTAATSGDSGATTVTDTAGIVWHVSLHNVTAIGIAP